MDLKDAEKEAEKDENINEIIEKGGYLCSAYTFVKRDEEIGGWNLNYYDPAEKNTTNISINEKGSETGFAQEPFRRKPPQKLDIDEVEISSDKALEIADKEEKQKYGKPVEKILLSLQKSTKGEVWKITFITKVLSIILVEIDAGTGEIIKSKMSYLFKPGVTAY